jgi:hypothetical protein
MRAKQSLIDSWKANPAEDQRLLVRVGAGMADAQGALMEQGVTVRRRCKLIHGYVISCTAERALQLLDVKWIESVELDEPVVGFGSSDCTEA